MFVSVSLIILVTAFAVYLYVWRQYSYWKSLGVPTTELRFPYGTVKPANREHMCQTFGRYYLNGKDNGPFVGMHFFLRPVALLTDLSLIQNVFATDFQYFPNREFFYNESIDPLSAHLVSLEFERWKPLRTKLTPAFTLGKTKMLFPLVSKVCDELKASISRSIDSTKGTIEVQELMTCYTTDVIGSCCFGIECHSLRDPTAMFRQMGKKALKETQMMVFKAVLVRNFKALARWFGHRGVPKDVSEFFLGAVREVVEYREKNNVQRKDLLDALIQIRNNTRVDGDTMNFKRFDVEQIAAQCFAFFLGGTETSSRTLSFALYELSLPENRQCLEKAREEIIRAMEKHKNEVTYEALDDMPYVEQIAKETLRKYPPFPFLSRIAVKDYRVPNTKVIFKKGQMVLIPIYGIHNDPSIYSEPHKFRPERFSGEESKTRPTAAFMPFAHGPRNCLAQKLGMLQTQAALVSMIKNFDFHIESPKDKVIFSRKNIVLESKDGIYINFTAIQT